jgi:DNA-binding CsgD family transcriptional regulator
VAARDSQALGKVSGDFEDMGAMLYAAEASAEAAVLLRRAGQARDAAAVEQKAARLLARCEGAATPPVQIITARVRLTPGELDAAVQAAAGRSNKQIASDMQLSVRTVESHLQRVRQARGLRPARASRRAAGAANRLTGERCANPVGHGPDRASRRTQEVRYASHPIRRSGDRRTTYPRRP